jgi:integrase
MASTYARGRVLWMRSRGAPGGKPIQRSTGYRLCHDAGESGGCPTCATARAAAQRYADEIARLAAEQRPGAPIAVPTVAAFASAWVAERKSRRIASARQAECRMNLHVLPTIGSRPLDQVSRRDVRDLVRGLRAADRLAPRTIALVAGDLRSMFASAVVEEIIAVNPAAALPRGELPPRVDRDPEWRASAVFSTREVEMLISDPRIPVDRRVVNAIKALAGLRHGEVAGLRWRHFDAGIAPLGSLLVATSYDTGRTKTATPRRVPVHATLAAILASWKLEHWPRIHGRTPGLDDYIVPSAAGTPLTAPGSARRFREDLQRLGLRVKAGRFRSRGGHDLRSFFISACQENGAHADLLKIVTHPARRDVWSGYTRASWPALCAEVSKLKCSILQGEVLPLATGFSTHEKKVRNRWGKGVRAVGLESEKMPATSSDETRFSDDDRDQRGSLAGGVLRDLVVRLSTVLAEVDTALREGDVGRARELITSARALGEAASDARPALRVVR